MISANEARQLTKDLSNKKAELEVQMLEESIEEAAAAGKHKTTCKQLSQRAEEILTELGYTIEKYDSQLEGYWIEIIW